MAEGRAAEAIKIHEAVLKQKESTLGTAHPDTLVSRSNLAGAYVVAGRTDDAINLLEAACAGSESKLGLDHPAALASRNNLAEDLSRRRSQPPKP